MRGSRRLTGLRQRHRRCVRPRIPGFSPGGLGPHLTSSGSPRGLSSGFPFARRVLPFARLPLVSRRPAFSGSSPSAVARVPVPLRFPSGFPSASNAHASAAARRFRRRWSRAAGTNATSSATPLGSRDPPARRMGSGWARWDAATESPVTSGGERRTSPRPNCPDRPLLTRTCGLSPARNVT